MLGARPRGASAPKKASSACTACQARKSKCTGGIPCDRCRDRETECIIDLDTDGRRKVAIKRKQQEWEYDKTLLGHLLNILRDGSHEQIQHVIHIVRSEASMEDIREYVEGQLGEMALVPPPRSSFSQQERVGASSSRAPSVNRTRIMDMISLVDDPLYKVPASPWTTVITDDHLVSHLVSLWFTWSSPCPGWIDRTLFLRDMQSRTVASAQYCSPFLVNAILAHACPYSDYSDIRTMNGALSATMHTFLDEAKRLLDEEAGRASLTTLQGLAVLCNCVSAMGKDRQGRVYLRQITDMILELVQALPETRSGSTNTDSVMANAIRHTAWTLWHTTTAGCLLWHREPLIPPPSCEHPVLPPHDAATDRWTLYPCDRPDMPSVASHSACLFQLYSRLTPIVLGISRLLFGQDVQAPVPSTFGESCTRLIDQLFEWFESFPGCIALTETPTLFLLKPYLYYHHLVILLCSFMEAGRQVDPERTVDTARTPPPDRISSAQIASALEIARLLELNKRAWGASRVGDAEIYWVSSALFALVRGHLDDASCHDAFLTLCNHARSYARRWKLGKGVLRMVQIELYERGGHAVPQTLSPDINQFFVDFQANMWRDQVSEGHPVDVEKEFRGQFPNPNQALKRFRLRSQPQMHRLSMDGSSPELPVVEMDRFLKLHEVHTL